MKLLAVLAVSNAFSNAEKLKCWTCENGSMDECQRLGKFKTCRDNSSCQVEWRSRYGATSKVKMGCKQTTACQNNQKQNFINWRLGKRFTQCRPELKFSHSVCRHCCNESSSCFDATTRFSSWNRADWKSKTPAPITPTPTAPRPTTPTQPPITRGLGPMCDQANCGDGWCLIDSTCYKLLPEKDEKNTLKRACKKEGAILATPISQKLNSDLKIYLDMIRFPGQEVWLGLNDGITEGTYVKDNTKNPVIYIDWFNWDENAGDNTDEMSSVKFNYDSETWFRYTAESYAHAVCTKDAPGSPSRSLEEEKTCDQGVCEDGWCQIEDTCYKLLDEVDQKNTLKKQCKTEGAILATPMSETDNDNLWEYLDLINFQNQGQEVWLGLNDGITEGTYVQDNTKNPVVYIDWFNWDENAGNNTDELSS